MKRRTFLAGTGLGVGYAGFSSLQSCGLANPSRSATPLDPGSYRTGHRHLIFGAVGPTHEIKPTAHIVTSMAGSNIQGFRGNSPFNYPVDAVVDSDGSLFVLDQSGRVRVFHADGTDSHALLQSADLAAPRDVHIHGDRVFVCDTLGHRVHVVSKSGDPILTLGNDHNQPGALNGPRGVAVAANGAIHVLDGGSATVCIFDSNGKPQGSYGEYGEAPGQMLRPRSIAIRDDEVWITDPSSGFVHGYSVDGTYRGRFVPRDQEGQPVAPVRCSIDHNGELYIWTAGHAVHRPT